MDIIDHLYHTILDIFPSINAQICNGYDEFIQVFVERKEGTIIGMCANWILHLIKSVLGSTTSTKH